MHLVLAACPLLAFWTLLSALRWYVMARHYERRFHLMTGRQELEIWEQVRFGPYPWTCRAFLLLFAAVTVLSTLLFAI